eukprot:TRINITY_DN11924_c0_g2_i1.p1 TRINITY_DN11924_c0_g2~~TRINITY_DN11924_c0_g2_i1.p1  ORF type:complete len:808 (+),score=182.92 TRINITY_DN11924_c0_g2_i1:77-2425(+)
MDGSEGHSLVEWRGRLYLFGGKKSSTDDYSNEVWELELDATGGACRAAPWLCQGSAPPPRAYHAACVWRGRYMVVVGGVTAEGQRRVREDAVWLLDLEERHWALQRTQGDAPHARCHHTLSVGSPGADRLLVYGGYPLGEEAERLFAADTVQPALRDFYGVYELTLEGTPSWVHRPCASAMPPMLWGHVALLYHQNLIVFGGVDVVDCTEAATVCVWHCEKLQWRWVEFPRAPLPRAIHAAAPVDGRMIVFGGFGNVNTTKYNDTWEFSLETGQWTELAAGGTVPSPRSGHAAALAAPGRLTVVGGADSAHRRLGDVYTLDLAAGLWRRANVTALPRPPTGAAGPAAPPPAATWGPGGPGAQLSPPRLRAPQPIPTPLPPAQGPVPHRGPPMERAAPPPVSLEHITPWTDPTDHPPPPPPPPPPPQQPPQQPPPQQPPPSPFNPDSTTSLPLAPAQPPHPADHYTSDRYVQSQAVQTERLPTAHASPPRLAHPPPAPTPQPVLVPVESAEAQWLHAEAADIIQKQRVEIELLRTQLESWQAQPQPPARQGPQVPTYGTEARGVPPGPNISLTKDTIADMMPRLAIDIAATPASAPKRLPGEAGGLMSREATAALVERRLAGGAWDSISPLLNPALLPTAPVDCARHTTQRRDLGLAAPQPQGLQSHGPPPPGPPPAAPPADLAHFNPLGTGAVQGDLPPYHPQRYAPPQSFAELMQRAEQRHRPASPAALAGGARSAQVSPERPGSQQRPHRSPSLRKILAGEASMLSITHVDARREAAVAA